MFFLLEKLNVSAVIMGEKIYQKIFRTFLSKVLLNMNLLHLIRLTKMAQQNEFGALYLIWPDLCHQSQIYLSICANMLLWALHLFEIIVIARV